MAEKENKLIFIQIAAKILLVAVQSMNTKYWHHPSKTYEGHQKISTLFPDEALAELVAKALKKSVDDAILYGELLSIRSLKTTYLTEDKITNLEGIGYLANMKALQLFGTALNQLPEEIKHLHRLQHLEVESGQISEIPACVCALPKLKVLILKKQLLTDLPNMKGQHVNIRSLDLEANNFSKVPDALKSFLLLESLNFSRNPIQQLPQFLTDLPHVHDLDFSQTNLESIPSTVIKTARDYKLNVHDTPVDNQLLAIMGPRTSIENQREKYIFTYEKKNNKKHILTSKKNKPVDYFILGVATALVIGKIIQTRVRK